MFTNFTNKPVKVVHTLISSMDKTISSAGKATISESEGLNTVSKDIIPIF